MPIVFKKDQDDFSIGIWKSTESFEELLSLDLLSRPDLDRWNGLLSDKRKREWLTVRVLLKSLFPNEKAPIISYDGNGKPYLDRNLGVSISHTKEFVAILISKKNHAGIDLEGVRERITVLSEKFVNDLERKSVPLTNQIAYLHVLWGAKEALFKLYGRGELDFKENLFIEPFKYLGKGTLNAWIKKNDLNKIHQVSYELWEGMMLVYSVSD